MEDIDEELQNTVLNSAMKNDPWEPLENKMPDIPKICPAPQDPLKNLICSETYVKSLEKRLNKLKGKNDKVKPKDMIQSLHEARDLLSSQYMSENTINTNSADFLSENSESVISSIQRRLNPEKQALNTQELVPLVHEDILAKLSEDPEDSKEGEGITSEGNS